MSESGDALEDGFEGKLGGTGMLDGITGKAAKLADTRKIVHRPDAVAAS